MKLKRILVPTDFSDAADNAVQYALGMSKELDCSIMLFHAYHIPVPTAEMPIMVFSPQEIEKDNMERLDKYRNELKKGKYAEAQIECICRPGFAVDEINDLAEEKKADLILMGVSEDGKFLHALLGSTSTAVLKDAQVPLLVVPGNAKYTGLKKIALACDYEHGLNREFFLHLKDFVALFHAHLFVVGVHEQTGNLLADYTITDSQFLEMELKGTPHTLCTSLNTDVTAGLLEFENHHQVDLIVMIPRKHSFFSRLFHTSNTKDMVFHSHIPVLALHE